MGNDPILSLSQSNVQTTTLLTPLCGPAARNRTWINSLEGYCTIHCATARIGARDRTRTGTYKTGDFKSPVATITPLSQIILVLLDGVEPSTSPYHGDILPFQTMGA